MAESWFNGFTNSFESDLYDSFAPVDEVDDPVLQSVFHAAYFDFNLPTRDKVAAREALKDYLLYDYGIDFDTVFDWRAYKAAYGEAA